jgi:hypothetical protein
VTVCSLKQVSEFWITDVTSLTAWPVCGRKEGHVAKIMNIYASSLSNKPGIQTYLDSLHPVAYVEQTYGNLSIPYIQQIFIL